MHSELNKKGLLLINLGTPAAPTKKAVGRFLREFLMDPFVITLPSLVRWVLVNLIIVPFRTANSTEAYETIWTEKGSPLMYHSEALADGLSQALGDHWHVALGMRYGSPSIQHAIDSLVEQGCDSITIFPLYPQYAESTSRSSIEVAHRYIKKHHHNIPVLTHQDYYDHPSYIDAQTQVIQHALSNQPWDILLFSFHGLPENHIHEVCHSQSCDLNSPCPVIGSKNRDCYRAQCYATARAIAANLDLAPEQYKVGFQSRLGRTPWIQPYSDHLLEDFAKQGIKQIAVACPSFTTDCLETIEEIGIRAKEQWASLGGEAFTLAPCVNAEQCWIDAIVKMINSTTLITDE